MGIDKNLKSVYCRNLDSSDKVRDMLIASANYSQDVGFCPVQEIIVQAAPKALRKRRLDHLSNEEKMRRKKLKNREAAQTSRDRKKAYVTSLEEAVRLLQQENKLLTERVSLLEDENKKLRENDVISPVVNESTPSGPAVSTDPLQQGVYLRSTQVKLPSQHRAKPMTHHRTLTLLALMSVLTSWTGSQKIFASMKMTPTMTWRKTLLISLLQNSSLLPQIRKKLERRWWGPGGGTRAWRPPPLCL